jgi:hypothetical protein
LDEQHADETQLDPSQQTHVDDQPVIEFNEELNLTQPPVLTESAEQPHHCTGDVSPQPTDYDDVVVSTLMDFNSSAPTTTQGRIRYQGKKQRKEAKKVNSSAASPAKPLPVNWSSMSAKARKNWYSHSK